VKSVILLLKRALLLTVKSANVPLVPELPPVRLVIFAEVAVIPVKLALGAERPNVKSPVVAVIVFTFEILLLHIFSEPEIVVAPVVMELVVIEPVESVFTVILLVVKNPVEILVAFNLLVLIVLTDRVSAIKFKAVKAPVLMVEAIRSCVSKVVKVETITDDGKVKSFSNPCAVLSSCCCVANLGVPFH